MQPPPAALGSLRLLIVSLGAGPVALTETHFLFVTGNTFAEVVVRDGYWLRVWLERTVDGPPFLQVRPFEGMFIHTAELASVEEFEAVKPFLIEAHAASLKRPHAPALDVAGVDVASRMLLRFTLVIHDEVVAAGKLVLTAVETTETVRGYTFTHRFGRPATLSISGPDLESAVVLGVSSSKARESLALGATAELRFVRLPLT